MLKKLIKLVLKVYLAHFIIGFITVVLSTFLLPLVVPFVGEGAEGAGLIALPLAMAVYSFFVSPITAFVLGYRRSFSPTRKDKIVDGLRVLLFYILVTILIFAVAVFILKVIGESLFIILLDLAFFAWAIIFLIWYFASKVRKFLKL